MKEYYLAIDIGASGGRHILSHIEEDKMVLEEIYRFPNEMKSIGGELIWDVEALFQEIIIGLKKCKELGKIPKSIGIDTWAVDFVLLDEDDHRIGNAVGYRDSRTTGMDLLVYEKITENELYARTGIQKQIFNTIYQLMALKCSEAEPLKKAKSLLMIPDYFHFLLTGNKMQEYTNATTTQLVSPETNDWDYELIELLGYPKEIFIPIAKPGTTVGFFKREIAEQVGYDCKVILPATHDTGSAVAAVPAVGEDTLYISSGTWSLMGTELRKADCSAESYKHNFTNEGGVDKRFRYLKNIMGLWMLQSMKKEIAEKLSYGEICDMASKSDITSILDVNDQRFLAPENMTEEIRQACRDTGQQLPETIAEVAAVIYNSLAVCYGKIICEVEALTGKRYDRLHIVGGGANAQYLNELTAKYTNKEVLAGPTEATAIGNILVQMRADGIFKSLEEARACVRNSFEIYTYTPKQ